MNKLGFEYLLKWKIFSKRVDYYPGDLNFDIIEMLKIEQVRTQKSQLLIALISNIPTFVPF